jgi:ATP-binding cassette subfamily B protein
LINLVMRFYDPTEGQIRINGRDLRQWDTAALRSKIALVTQDPFIFSASIRDNILRGNPQLSRSALDDLLEAARCRELVAKFPQGIDTVLSEGGRSISSGERQLLSIARALARDPDLIILDEATSYIDSETEEKIQAALTHLMSHRTAIVVAHRLSTARTADTIIVLNRGRVIESGSDQALMAQGGFYYRLNQLQR